MLVTIESELKWEMNTLKKRGRLSVEAIARGTLSEGMRETESDKEKTGFLEGFSDLEDFWDDLRVSRLEVVWKSSGSRLEVVWTSWKSSGLPGSRLDFQEVVWTSRKSSRLPGSRLDF
ncbi:hypothetical protein YC2023_023900 [Brassica napus]